MTLLGSALTHTARHLSCLCAMFTALLVLPAQASDWVVSQAGGSAIEMPAFFDDGVVVLSRDTDQEVGVTYRPDHTISLHQYRVKSRLRPYAF